MCFAICSPLLCQLEANKANLNNIAGASRQRVTCRLVVQIRAIGAARVLYIPYSIAKPHTCMFSRNERFANLNGIGWPAPDRRLRVQAKTCARRDFTWSAIYHDQVPYDWW